MSEHSFFARLEVSIVLDDEEFAILEEKARHHYDFAVQAMVEVGGVLYDARNSRNFYKTREENTEEELAYANSLDLTFRQLDKILKSMELVYPPSERAQQLNVRLHKIARDMQEKGKEINDGLKFCSE